MQALCCSVKAPFPTFDQIVVFFHSWLILTYRIDCGLLLFKTSQAILYAK